MRLRIAPQGMPSPSCLGTVAYLSCRFWYSLSAVLQHTNDQVLRESVRWLSFVTGSTVLLSCSKRGIPGHEALRLLFSGALPDFVNLAEIPGELELALPNALGEDMETESPQDTRSFRLNNLSSY